MQFYLDEKNAAVRLSHRVTFHNTGEHDADIALFWFVKEPPGGYRELLHGGGSFGTTSLCLLVPQHKIGVICIANDAAPETERTLTLLSEVIAKTLITLPPVISSSGNLIERKTPSHGSFPTGSLLRR
jgi:serine-type D-Ala-D-Ala carboxypeptidase/endopeptidase